MGAKGELSLEGIRNGRRRICVKTIMLALIDRSES